MPPADWALRAGPYRAGLEATGPIGERLRSLLIDLHTEADTGTVGHLAVTANRSGNYTMSSDGRLWDDDVADADLADEMVHLLLRAALDAEPDLVHIHAGAVGLGDRTAIIAGWPGSGKSSAITAMVGSGFDYVTDERLAVSSDGRSVAGFPKPISLICASFDAFAHLNPAHTGIGEHNDTAWQIPASSFGSVAPPTPRSPSVVVFIAYRPEAALQAIPLTPADAAARLLGDSPDIAARGRAGADAIASLTSTIPSLEIEYSNPRHLVETMRQLFDAPPTVAGDAPLVIEGAPPSGAPPPATPEDVDVTDTFSVAEGVTAWILGDQAFAYVNRSGTVVELDATSTVWLQLLDDDHSLGELIDEVAAVTATEVAAVRSTTRQVVHQLWTAGVIAPTRHG